MAKSFASHLVTDELSYNLVRKYPFGRAFKWWILGIFACFMGLLTVFNLAVNGFDRNFTYTIDPNTTAQQTHWYNSPVFTWGSDNLSPVCQSQQIPVGHRFITTNLGLQYAVSNIQHQDGKNSTPRAAFSYLNNRLQDCDVTKISLRLVRSDNSLPVNLPEIYRYKRYTWIDSYAFGTARCYVDNKEGRFAVDFVVDYKPNINDFSNVVSDNRETNAAIWWGIRLLNAYFAGVLHVMSGLLPDGNKDTPIYTSIRIDLWTRSKKEEPKRSIHNTNLYRLDYMFLTSNGTVSDKNFQGNDSKPVYNDPSFEFSRPLTEAFMWSKIWRSFILADLGNTEAENLLTNHAGLQYAVDPDDDFNRKPGAPLEAYETNTKRWNTTNQWMYFAMPNPTQFQWPIRLKDAYPLFKNTTVLEAKNASIFAEYICSVPGRRSPLAMIMFTLVANLAVFHTIWLLFKYAVDRRVSWMDPRSSWCDGCVAMARDGTELGTHVVQMSELHGQNVPLESQGSIGGNSAPDRDSTDTGRRSSSRGRASPDESSHQRLLTI